MSSTPEGNGLQQSPRASGYTQGNRKMAERLSKTPDNPEQYSWLLKPTNFPHVVSLTVTARAYGPVPKTDFGCPSCSPRRQES